MEELGPTRSLIFIIIQNEQHPGGTLIRTLHGGLLRWSYRHNRLLCANDPCYRRGRARLCARRDRLMGGRPGRAAQIADCTIFESASEAAQLFSGELYGFRCRLEDGAVGRLGGRHARGDDARNMAGEDDDDDDDYDEEEE